MKRLMYLTMCLFALCVAVTSCSDKADGKDKVEGKAKAENGLVGKWEHVVEQAGAKAVVTYDFRENGMVTQTMVMKSESPLIDIEGEAEFEYKYADGVITFKFSGEDVHFPKFKMEGLSDEMVAMAMEQMKSSFVDVEQKITDVKIKGDKLTAMMQGIEITMTRM